MRWESFYTDANKGVDELIGNIAVHREFIKTIIDYAPVKNAAQTRLLEVGVGSGDMSIFLSCLNYKVTAIDNARGVLKNVKSRDLMQSVRHLELLLQDAFKMTFEDNSFDIAFSQGFFEHFSDLEIVALLREQLRVACTVIFSVPSCWFPRRDMGNERLMTVQEWLAILFNLKVDKAFYYGLSGRKVRYLMRRKPMEICIVVQQ